MSSSLVIALTLGMAATPEDKASSKTTLSVMDIRGEGEFSRTTTRMLSELLATEAATYSEYQVTSERDMTALMNLERKNQLLGCHHEHCVVEVAQALGSERIIFSSVGLVGEYFLLSCKLFDGVSGKILRRWAKQIHNDEAALVGAMKLAIDALLGKSASVSQSELLTAGTPSEARPSIAPWLTGTVAVLSAAAGTWLGHIAQEDLSVAPTHPSYADKLDGAEKKVLGANLSFGLAGAAGLLTGLLIVF